MAAAATGARSCLVCLRPVPRGEYHVACLRKLFGADVPPAIDLTEATIQTVALATLGHTIMPGVQPKISLGLVRDQRKTLRIVIGGTQRYILKPQNAEFPALPENEHVSMQIARLFGILVPAHGLIRLADGSLAYIVERFDRMPDGRKLHQEDFGQLAGITPSEKYDLFGVDCARIVERYSSRARADLIRLFERFVLAWWVGDGDLHAKNLSLLAGPDGRHSLSPAYDIVSLAVYKDYSSALALPLSPEDGGATSDAWRRFAEVCRLAPPVAAAILRRPTERLDAALDLVDRSYLPTRAMRSDYRDCLRARAEALAG
jgi:serine/threonine-protein kinase HipA